MRFADALGRLLALTTGIPHVSTCHSLFEGGKWFSSFGRETIAVSEAVRDMLVGTYGKPPGSITVLYHELKRARTLSAKQRRDAAKNLALERARTVLFNVGRLAPEKAPGITLKAMRILKERGMLNGTKLLMVGDGELRDSLVSEIKSLALDDNIVLLPETTDVDVVLNIADFGVLSSRREGGIPYIILEAASLGKPVVATATGGVPEFIREKETGMLAPVGNEVLLADAIQYLLENRAILRRIGRNAKQRFQQFHLSNHSTEKTLAIYKKAIG
jgi:glycosyltransferase involved in cell wall biosynthesis